MMLGKSCPLPRAIFFLFKSALVGISNSCRKTLSESVESSSSAYSFVSLCPVSAVLPSIWAIKSDEVVLLPAVEKFLSIRWRSKPGLRDWSFHYKTRPVRSGSPTNFGGSGLGADRLKLAGCPHLHRWPHLPGVIR